MADSPTHKDSELQVNLRRISDPGVPSVAVHHFAFSAVDDDVQVEIGHFDLVKLKEAIESARTNDGAVETLDLYILGRFAVGPRAALTMLNAAEKIVEYYRLRGRILDGNTDDPVPNED